MTRAHRVADSAIRGPVAYPRATWQASGRRARAADAADPRRARRPPRPPATAAAEEGAERHGTARVRRWAGTASPRRSAPAAPRSAGCCSTCCWSAWSACSWSRGRLRLPLQDDQAAGPERRLRDQHVVRLLRRRREPSSAGTPTRTATRSPTTEMPQDVKDAVVAAENRTLLERQRRRRQGHRPRGVQQRLGQRHPGRVDDHPAVHQDPLPHPGALLHAQAEGGDPLPQAGSRQVSKQEILEGYLNTIYFGRGAYGIQAAAQAYFDKDAAELDLKESAALASIINNPTPVRPGQRQGLEAGAARALPLRARRHGQDGRDHRRRGRSRPGGSCRSSRGSRPTTSTAARRATC